MKSAGLIHLLDWNSKLKEFELAPGIKILALKGSQVEEVYLQACANGLDDGEPHDFTVAIELEYEKLGKKDTGDFQDPNSLGCRILNIISICTGSAIGFVRTILYPNDYWEMKQTYVSHDYTAQRDFLINKPNISESDIPIIIKTFNNVNSIWEEESANSNIINALTYFYFSWDMHYIEQTAINLAISLECLFAPHSNSEIIHQISFNVAHFMLTEKDERQQLYKQLKKFYSVRSRIVHGGLLKDKDMDTIPEAFTFVSRILKKIISDPQLVTIFNNNELRKKYLDNLIFA